MTVRVGVTGTIRLDGDDLTALRRACYERDGGHCVICGRSVMWESGYYGSMHMAHIKARGAGGSDTLENVETKCPRCHFNQHNPRAVPKKVKR